MAYFPHEDLPLRQINFETFLGESQSYEHDGIKLVNLMLCGRFGEVVPGGGFETEERIAVNPRMDGRVPPLEDLMFTRDYDSAIGITRSLPFTRPLSVYPVPPFSETLKKDNHITHVMPHASGRQIKVPLHRIPNVAIGKVMKRHVTRIFFPRLYDPEGSPALDQEQLGRLYDEHVRVAVYDTIPNHGAHWPINYQAALKQSQDRQGRLHVGSVDIPMGSLAEFSRELLDGLEADPQFCGAFFVHELRGSKGVGPHEPEDEEDREHALDEVMAFVNAEEIDQAEWNVDVGLEIRDPGHVVQWLTNGHLALLSHLLPSLSEAEVGGLLRSSHYQQDHMGHLQDFSGFRLDPRRRGVADRVQYINVYCNEKTVTYQLHEGIFSWHRMREVLPKDIVRLSQDVVEMSRIYKRCSGIDGPGQEGMARVEIRVPLMMALDLNVVFPEEVVERCLISVPSMQWWMYKFFRAKALNNVLLNMVQAPIVSRGIPSCLTLAAVIVHLINGLNHRPGDNRPEMGLLARCSRRSAPEDPEEEEDDEDDEEDEIDRRFGPPVMYRHGIYFLAGIYTKDLVWRMGGGLSLPMEELVKLYKVGTRQMLMAQFTVSSVTNRDLPRANPSRVPNRQVRMTDDVTEEAMAEEEEPNYGFKLKARGVVLNRGLRATGDDIHEDEDDEMGGGGVAAGDDPDLILSKIWRQFPHDVMAQAANKQSAADGSYLLLDVAERSNASHVNFQKQDLTGVFEAVQARLVAPTTWTGKIMELYFPKKGYVAKGRVQNFPKCLYYNMWASLMTRVRGGQEGIVRNELGKKFGGLMWLPYPETDRMWSTRRSTARWIGKGGEGTGGGRAPSIGINGKYCRDLGQIKVGEVDHRVEDDSDDSDESLMIVGN